ncbi:host attachment family protein [Sphingomonas naphthae]|uniref:Host attachment family protein n=1 Tax=Sphingomonas naphthae TaxID=1813468 RepID=A0ABY7TMP1_9SPHN|nr:host attachment family protein [Sphingomonas naphthae]WCT74220.1 host attachment family protein [Sphingomonas naphthae]
MRLAHNSVVVVADGRKMLFFRNEGDAEYPNLTVEDQDYHPNPRTGEQATDQAGRASNTIGGRASSVEPTDFHQIEEDRFAAQTVALLNKKALAGDYEQLIIVAPAQTLGEMRKHYHKETEKRLKGEIAKDLTGHPVDQIEKIIVEQE